tara:strand:+ start:405 stop:638 length:234 start_codon:yes stop_codon:yes gene_type:complete
MKLSKEEDQWLYGVDLVIKNINNYLSDKIVETRELLEDARKDKNTELSSYLSETIFMCESIRNKIEIENQKGDKRWK